MFATLLDLIFPTVCAGCARPGAALCRACAAPLRHPDRHRPRPVPAGLPPVYAAGRYEAGARAALIAFKDRGRRDLAAVLGAALAAAIGLAMRELGLDAVTLVAVPTRRRAARARGRDHLAELTTQAARSLAGGGTSVRVVRALRVSSGAADSVGLSAAQRLRNRVGTMSATAAAASIEGPVVVVDDLVTTGSTLAEAARALRAAQLPVAAAAVVAATQRRIGTQRRPQTFTEVSAGVLGLSDFGSTR